jgi:hypothetical protein
MQNLGVVVLAVLTAAGVSAGEATLHWTNGDNLPGMLLSSDGQSITWESGLFADPLQVELGSLALVKFEPQNSPSEKSPTDNDEGFRILMRNGDVLVGQLAEVLPHAIRFESPRFGKFEIAREHVLSLQKLVSKGFVYSGPRGLEGWQPVARRSPNEPPMRVVGGMVVRAGGGGDSIANQAGIWSENPDGSLSTLRADEAIYLPLKLPEKCEIELEVRSTKSCSFAMVLGKDVRSGPRLQTWVDVLVAANGPRFSELLTVGKDDHAVHLHVFLDFPANTMTVYSSSGKKLGQIAAATPGKADRERTKILKNLNLITQSVATPGTTD